MKAIKLFILISVFYLSGCTYNTIPLVETCTTDFSGFPDMPGWNISEVPRDTSSDNGHLVYFLSEQKGFVYGYDGIHLRNSIWMTEDGAQNWEKVFSDPNLYLDYMTFSDARHGFVAANTIQEGRLLKTTDGGLNWQMIYYQPDDVITQLTFADSLRGFAIFKKFHSGVDFYNAKTFDGGRTWEEIPELSATPYPGLLGGGIRGPEMKAHSNGFGYIGGYNGEIHLTGNYGQTWKTIQTGLDIILHNQFLDENTGFASDNNSLYKTLDGGNTWNIASLHKPEMFHFFSPLEGISLQVVASDYIDSYEPFERECMAFLTTSDGGLSWIEGSPSKMFYMESIVFVNPNLAYASSFHAPGIVRFSR